MDKTQKNIQKVLLSLFIYHNFPLTPFLLQSLNPEESLFYLEKIKISWKQQQKSDQISEIRVKYFVGSINIFDYSYDSPLQGSVNAMLQLSF